MYGERIWGKSVEYCKMYRESLVTIRRPVYMNKLFPSNVPGFPDMHVSPAMHFVGLASLLNRSYVSETWGGPGGHAPPPHTHTLTHTQVHKHTLSHTHNIYTHTLSLTTSRDRCGLTSSTESCLPCCPCGLLRSWFCQAENTWNYG